MAPGITIVGLGPGDASLWTVAAQEVFDSCTEIWLRTARHPSVQAFSAINFANGGGIDADRAATRKDIHSFDSWYEQASDFPTLFEEIASRVVKLGQREEGVVYAVPGHPSVGEETVPHIRAKAAECDLPLTIVPGLSYLEPMLSALGIDALSGLQLVDADQVAAMHHPPLDPDRPTIILQLYTRRQAAQVKLTLMNVYPDTHNVSIVQAAGTDREQVTNCSLFEIDRQPALDHSASGLYVPALAFSAGLPTFQETIAHLRAPDGCPWDLEQTHISLRPYLLEESHEVLEALDAEDMDALAEELGDLLLQIVLHAQIATESGEFNMGDVIGSVDQKMRRRHPHVFSDVMVNGVPDVLSNWEAIKAAEKGDSQSPQGRLAKIGDNTRKSAVDGVPTALPALARAQTLSRRAARTGFEWPNLETVLQKLAEETQELAEAKTPQDREYELGDVLFVLVNLARWLDVDAESALRTTSDRFHQRFVAMERLLQERNLNLSDLEYEALDRLWRDAKLAAQL